MSYSGEISGAAVLVPLAIGALAIGAAVKTVQLAGRVVGAAGIAVNNAVQTARFNSVKGKLSEVTQGADALDEELSDKMSQAVSECYSQYEKAVSDLSEQFSQQADTTQFVESCRKARQDLEVSLRNTRRELEDNYISRINTEMHTRSAEMNAQRRSIEESIQRMSDDMQRKDKARELAEAAMVEAETMISEMTIRYSGSQKCQSAAAACEELCNKSKAHLEAGLCEAALAEAFSAKASLMTRVNDMMQSEIRSKQAFVDASAAVQAVQKLLDDHKSVSYNFERTRSGEPEVKEVADFTAYYRGSYEECRDKIAALQSRLSGRDFRDFIPEELEDIAREAGNIQDTFVLETQTAYERLDCELMRRETAKLLAAKYIKLGYRPLPLTDEDKAVSPIDSIIIRLGKSDTDERLYLRLNAVTDAGGRVTMNIEMEDHTEYEGSYDQIEQSRAKERQENCDLISNSNVGKKLQLRHRCKNPGVLDTYQRPQN